MGETFQGLDPVYDENSKVLILGSFPSVKSREVAFYYGNPQNRFWRTLSSFFGEDLPKSTEEKRAFLKRNKIALWDIVTECEIVGSQDAAIKNFCVADINSLLQNSQIGFIILNGGKAFGIFEENYGGIKVPYVKLSSTSPANPRFTTKEWFDVLSRAFDRT